MVLFFHFVSEFVFLAALTAAVDVRQMSIDEYINFVNPPAGHKNKTKFGDTILCVKFSDQISVKYASDNITRSLKKPPILGLPTRKLPSFGKNIAKLGDQIECPENTVPIREIKREEVEKAGSVSKFLDRGRRRYHPTPNVDENTGNRGHEAANPMFLPSVSSTDCGHVKSTFPSRARENGDALFGWGNITGLSLIHNSDFIQYAAVRWRSPNDPLTTVTAGLNTWRPQVEPDTFFSLSQIWFVNEDIDRNHVESIEAGWMVSRVKYGDDETRLFVYWTSDNYLNGCYNEECPGFVSLHPIAKPGQILQPVSQSGGEQYGFQLSIDKKVRQDVGIAWYIYFEGVTLGYWPGSLFGSMTLGLGANSFQVGGEVSYTRRAAGVRLTETEMGSGVYPEGGYRRAAYTKKIQVYGTVDEIHAAPLSYVTKPRCYDMKYGVGDQNWGKYIFFGGSGGVNGLCVA